MEFDIHTKISCSNGSDLITLASTLQHFTSQYLYVSNGKLYAVTLVTDLSFSGKLSGFANGCFELTRAGESIYCFRKELADYLQSKITPETETDPTLAKKFSQNNPAKNSRTKQGNDSKEFNVQKLVQEGLVLPTIDKEKQKEKQEELKTERCRQRKLKKKLLEEERKKARVEREKNKAKKQATKNSKKIKIQPSKKKQDTQKAIAPLCLGGFVSVQSPLKLPTFNSSIVAPLKPTSPPKPVYDSDDDSDYEPSKDSDNESDCNPIALQTLLDASQSVKETGVVVSLASLMKLGNKQDKASVSSFPHTEIIPDLSEEDDSNDDNSEDDDSRDDKDKETKTEETTENVPLMIEVSDDLENDSEENDPMVQARQQAAQSICDAIRQKRQRTVKLSPDKTQVAEPNDSSDVETDSSENEEIPNQIIPRKFVDEVPLELIPENLQKIIADVFFDTYEETAIFHYEGGMFIMETWNGLTSVFDVDNVLNLPRLKAENYHRCTDGTPKSLPFAQFKKTKQLYQIDYDISKPPLNPIDRMRIINEELTNYFRENKVSIRTTFNCDLRQLATSSSVILSIDMLRSVSDDRKFLNITSQIPGVTYSDVDN